MKKYSIVGLSLLAVSAITAAFVPSKASNSSAAINGIIDLSTGLNNNPADNTCRERVAGDGAANCSFTNTGAGALSSTDLNVDSNSVSAAAANTLSATTAQGVD